MGRANNNNTPPPDQGGQTTTLYPFKNGLINKPINNRLPFGAKCSPAIFNDLTQAVRRMMAHKEFLGIVVYLDDFLVVVPTKSECQATFEV